MGYFLNKLAEEAKMTKKELLHGALTGHLSNSYLDKYDEDRKKRSGNGSAAAGAALTGAGLIGAGYHLGNHGALKALANGTMQLGPDVVARGAGKIIPSSEIGNYVKEFGRKAGRMNTGMGLAAAGMAAYGAKKLYDKYKSRNKEEQ